jgi:hypothetical protein
VDALLPRASLAFCWYSSCVGIGKFVSFFGGPWLWVFLNPARIKEDPCS